MLIKTEKANNIFADNHFYNILRYFDVFSNVLFTTSEPMRGCYLQTRHTHVALQIAQVKTWDLNKVGHIRKVSKPHRIIG